MSTESLGPGPRTRIRRLARKAVYDRDTIFTILDEARYCHVTAIVEGRALALPTLHAREAQTLYVHASPSNEILRAVLEAGEAFVTATIFDGLRLARSGFESSIAYRSVVVSARAREVEDESEKERVLNLFFERVLPGRSSEVRPISQRELRLTKVVAISIDEASAKVSSGPTDDALQDRALPIWSGTVPARTVFATPRPDTNGAMSEGEWPLPESVRNLLDSQ